MKPSVPSIALRPRGLTSAPAAETLASGDLIPGVPDIPYVRGAFLMEGDIPDSRGRRRTVAQLHEACCTFWDPSIEERAMLAAGGMVQILTFAPKPPLTYVTAAAMERPIPETPACQETIARLLYEKTTPGSSWDTASIAAKRAFRALADDAFRIYFNWQRMAQEEGHL